jgi:transcription termination factor Rho
MTVLDRSELEASSLADLHQIADEVGLEGFRRLRKADLIDTILGERGGDEEQAVDEEDERPAGPARPARRQRSRSRSRRGASSPAEQDEVEATVDGVVEILANGSALLRVSPPEESDRDVYVSAAQVRRCELVPGDRVSGPTRPPRRSERHPSLVRVDTINGASADSVSEGTRYEELAVAYPSEHLTFDSEDPTLKAIEWLTPIGRGSRVTLAGAARSGKTEALRRMAAALSGREGLELTLVLAGARPEEIAEWGEQGLQPAVALGFATSADAQAQAVDAAIETAKRLAARGADAVVLVDGLGGLPPHAARKALAAARNLRESGSLTVIATAPEPLGGETTVIALDALLAGSGRFPALDLVHSGTLRPELLVGEDGAEAIARARQESR